MGGMESMGGLVSVYEDGSDLARRSKFVREFKVVLEEDHQLEKRRRLHLDQPALTRGFLESPSPFTSYSPTPKPVPRTGSARIIRTTSARSSPLSLNPPSAFPPHDERASSRSWRNCVSCGVAQSRSVLWCWSPQKWPKMAQISAVCVKQARNQGRAASWAMWLKTEFQGHLVHP